MYQRKGVEEESEGKANGACRTESQKRPQNINSHVLNQNGKSHVPDSRLTAHKRNKVVASTFALLLITSVS